MNPFLPVLSAMKVNASCVKHSYLKNPTWEFNTNIIQASCKSVFESRFTLQKGFPFWQKNVNVATLFSRPWLLFCCSRKRSWDTCGSIGNLNHELISRSVDNTSLKWTWYTSTICFRAVSWQGFHLVPVGNSCTYQPWSSWDTWNPVWLPCVMLLDYK